MNFNDEGHWYTSYPSLNHWTEDFTHKDYTEALAGFTRPLHLYLHIPFCAKLCWYCICNIVVSNDREKIRVFLDHLLKEIDLLKPYKPQIRDLHFGGGTPSHLNQGEFSELCDKLDELAPLKSLSEVAMEIDPRTVTPQDLKHYGSHGVNRISFGVQDFNHEVQRAINRIQPPEMIEKLLEERHLFKGVNFDLLYGLPLQTRQTFQNTLERTIEIRPERITLLKYCHDPELRRHMKLIDERDLPAKAELPKMFMDAIDMLSLAGYIWIGLDHFCLPQDSLSRKVGRTFNGFTSGTTEMIGVGPTTTGVFGSVYCQAEYNLNEYYRAIDKGEFPILRGYKMTPDDLKRREVIFTLLCKQRVSVDKDYFERELGILSEMTDVCEVYGNTIEVPYHGRLFLRQICKVFDVKDVKPEHHRIAQKSMTRRALEASPSC